MKARQPEAQLPLSCALPSPSPRSEAGIPGSAWAVSAGCGWHSLKGWKDTIGFSVSAGQRCPLSTALLSSEQLWLLG